MSASATLSLKNVTEANRHARWNRTEYTIQYGIPLSLRRLGGVGQPREHQHRTPVMQSKRPFNERPCSRTRFHIHDPPLDARHPDDHFWVLADSLQIRLHGESFVVHYLVRASGEEFKGGRGGPIARGRRSALQRRGRFVEADKQEVALCEFGGRRDLLVGHCLE